MRLVQFRGHKDQDVDDPIYINPEHVEGVADNSGNGLAGKITIIWTVARHFEVFEPLNEVVHKLRNDNIDHVLR